MLDLPTVEKINDLRERILECRREGKDPVDEIDAEELKSAIVALRGSRVKKGAKKKTASKTVAPDTKLADLLISPKDAAS